VAEVELLLRFVAAVLAIHNRHQQQEWKTTTTTTTMMMLRFVRGGTLKLFWRVQNRFRLKMPVDW
jgi:hypothetical protein